MEEFWNSWTTFLMVILSCRRGWHMPEQLCAWTTLRKKIMEIISAPICVYLTSVKAPN